MANLESRDRCRWPPLALATTCCLALSACSPGAQVAAGPLLHLEPGSLSFTTSAGGAAPAAQSLAATNAGVASLSVPALSTTYATGSTGWLSAEVAGTAAPFSIVVQVNPAGLAAGTYDATLTVASAGAANAPQAIPVSLTIDRAGGGPGTCTWLGNCVAISYTSSGSESCGFNNAKNGLLTNNCGEDIVCSLSIEPDVPPPLGSPPPGATQVNVQAGQTVGESMCSGNHLASRCAVRAAADACFGAPDAGSPTQCSTCYGAQLPACPDPTPSGWFGTKCCSSGYPYSNCSGGCAQQPVCCRETCSCNSSCQGGG